MSTMRRRPALKLLRTCVKHATSLVLSLQSFRDPTHRHTWSTAPPRNASGLPLSVLPSRLVHEQASLSSAACKSWRGTAAAAFGTPTRKQEASWVEKKASAIERSSTVQKLPAAAADSGSEGRNRRLMAAVHWREICLPIVCLFVCCSTYRATSGTTKTRFLMPGSLAVGETPRFQAKKLTVLDSRPHKTAFRCVFAYASPKTAAAALRLPGLSGAPGSAQPCA